MPQMSPLMWGNLFIVFSLFLIFSSVKIYFSADKLTPSDACPQASNQESLSNFNWTW